MRTGWWIPARRFIHCCGSVQPMLLNETFKSPPQYDFLSFPFRQRFGADLVHALESHYSIPCLVSILFVLYHIAPAWWGGWPFIAKGFVLIFKVVWPHGGADLVKTACPLLLLWHLWQNLLVRASVYRAETASPPRYHLHQTLLNPPGLYDSPTLAIRLRIDTDFPIQFDSDSKFLNLFLIQILSFLCIYFLSYIMLYIIQESVLDQLLIFWTISELVEELFVCELSWSHCMFSIAYKSTLVENQGCIAH